MVDGRVEEVTDEGGFTGTGDSADGGEAGLGNGEGSALKIAEGGFFEDEPIRGG